MACTNSIEGRVYLVQVFSKVSGCMLKVGKTVNLENRLRSYQREFEAVKTEYVSEPTIFYHSIEDKIKSEFRESFVLCRGKEYFRSKFPQTNQTSLRSAKRIVQKIVAEFEQFSRDPAQTNKKNKQSKKVKEDVFEVDRILAYKMEKKVLYVLVHWKGYDADHDTWEPVSNLCDSLQKYVARQVRSLSRYTFGLVK